MKSIFELLVAFAIPGSFNVVLRARNLKRSRLVSLFLILNFSEEHDVFNSN